MRGQKFNHRGDLLLHSSKTVGPNEKAYALEQGIDLTDLPLGHIVGVARLIDCQPVSYEGGRTKYDWLLDDIRRFTTPIPHQGAAAVFPVENGLVEAALASAVPVPLQVSHNAYQQMLDAAGDDEATAAKPAPGWWQRLGSIFRPKSS